MPSIPAKICLFVCVGHLFAYVSCSKGPSSGKTCIKITRKNYWILSGLYINEIPLLQLIGLYIKA